MRILHTMLRVGDLEKSVAFYTEVLGMTLLRRKDYPEGRFTNVFVGYGNEADHAVLFIGIAGQYVFEQHSFTLALDFQLNDARREVRTESQIDVEFSYTFTF